MRPTRSGRRGGGFPNCINIRLVTRRLERVSKRRGDAMAETDEPDKRDAAAPKPKKGLKGLVVTAVAAAVFGGAGFYAASSRPPRLAAPARAPRGRARRGRARGGRHGRARLRGARSPDGDGRRRRLRQAVAVPRVPAGGGLGGRVRRGAAAEDPGHLRDVSARGRHRTGWRIPRRSCSCGRSSSGACSSWRGARPSRTCSSSTS